MKRRLIYFSIFLISCSQSTSIDKDIQDMAIEGCKCYREIDSYNNMTKKIRKSDECFQLTQHHRYIIQELGVSEDLPHNEVMKLFNRYDSIYERCINTK